MSAQVCHVLAPIWFGICVYVLNIFSEIRAAKVTHDLTSHARIESV